MMRGVALEVISDEWLAASWCGVVQEEMPEQITEVVPEERMRTLLAAEHISSDATVVLSQVQILRLLDEERLAILVERIEKEYGIENSR
jgi:hypothetical protein